MRKSLKDISWLVSEDEYRADNALSYSNISRFKKVGFDGLSTLFDKQESSSLLFGSIVDTLLTDTEEAFKEKYAVATFPNIPDSQKAVAKLLFNKCSSKCTCLETIPDDLVLRACKELDYQSRWKDATKVANIRDNCSVYYRLLGKTIGKTIVSIDDYNDAIKCVNAFKESDATKWYFAKNSPFDDSIERLYQLKFKTTYNGIPVRCMMDLVVIDHENKVIIPVDIKTSSKPEWSFFKSFVEWNYYIQASLYYFILQDVISKDPYFKDFKIMDYRFIVVSRHTKLPLVWEYEDTKTEGDVVYDNGIFKTVLTDWRSLLSELHYYLNDYNNYPLGIDIYKINSIKEWLKK